MATANVKDQPTQNGSTDATATPQIPTAWNVVRTEQPDRIVFEAEGDCLIGRLVAKDVIQPPDVLNTKTGEMETPEPFLQLVWRDALVGNVGNVQDPDYNRLEGMPYVCANAGYAMEAAYENIPLETWTRNTLIKLREVKQASPMKDFRVEVAQG